MGKYCCVNGCKSGFVSDRRNRDKKKVRQVSLFKTPQCIELKDKWEKALSQKLNTNQFVCENHFHEKDILKAHRFFVDGIESIYPRIKWSLVNKNVIPVHQKSLDKDIPRKQKRIKRKNKNTGVAAGNDVRGGLHLKQELNHIDPVPKNEKPLVELNLPLPEVSRDNNVKAGIPLKQEFNHIDCVLRQQPSPVTGTTGVRPSLQFKQEIDHNGVVTHLETISTSPSTHAFTLGDIKTYFSSVLMEGWCYFATDAGFIFVHMNLLTRKEDKRFSIDKNLSVKVSFSQRPEFSEDVIISSIDDIITYMEYLSRTVLCKGTGMHDGKKKFATQCTGKVPSDDYKHWQQDPRCSECRKLRQIFQNKRCKAGTKHKVQEPTNCGKKL